MSIEDNASSTQSKLRLSTLWHSAFYNFALHYGRFFLPLMVMPYLSRVLGPNAYGQVFLSTSLGVMLSILIEFGFYLSATREVAKHLNDESRVALIVANVLSARLFLAAVAFIIGVAASMYVARFQQSPAFAYAGIAFGVAYGTSPIWYYRAIEKMRMQSALEIGGQVVAAALVFAFVRAPDDALLVPIFQASGAAFAVCGGHAVLYRNVPFLRPTLAGGIKAIQSGWTMFLFVSFCAIYSSASVFFVGVLLPPSQTAFFGLGEKLFSATTYGLFGPFEKTIFPRMNYLLANAPEKALRLAKISLALLLGAKSRHHPRHMGNRIFRDRAPVRKRFRTGGSYFSDFFSVATPHCNKPNPRHAMDASVAHGQGVKYYHLCGRHLQHRPWVDDRSGLWSSCHGDRQSSGGGACCMRDDSTSLEAKRPHK